MEDRPKNLKRPVIILVVAMIVIVLAFALWEFVVRDMLSSEDTEYKIEFWSGGNSMGKVRMSQLEDLSTVSFVDTLGSGTTDEGPLARDVILLMVDESSLANSTEIVFTSDLRGEETTITWGEIANESNKYILDFTNKGTTKFTSPTTEKKDRVRDITDITIGA